MLKKIKLAQIFIFLAMVVQTGFTQDKALVVNDNNGTFSLIKLSDVKNLKFSENFVTDEDGNVYKTVIIDGKEWMAENLKVTKYNDGTSIPLIADGITWSGLSAGAYCFYGNNLKNANTYGCLYNWYAVNTGKLAPTGWRVPTDADWTALKDYLTTDGHNTYEGSALKSTFGWDIDDNGTDDYGFTALPSGYRLGSDGSFYGLGGIARFLSATEDVSGLVWYRKLSTEPFFSDPELGNSDFYREKGSKTYGYSVRCVRDIGL